MSKQSLRLWILLLCLCLLGGSVSSLAGEAAENPESEPAAESAVLEEEFPFADRFGMEAVVETDEAGEPVFVNHFPTRRVRAGFNNLGQDESFQMVIDFVDYPFWVPATRYDGNLAVMSLMMAGCANRAIGFRDIPREDFDPSLNLEHFLSDAGFVDIRKDDYSKVPTMFTVSTAMGHRKMVHEGEDPFTLIAIGVCGEGYENEWESNMTAGTGEIHEGFRSAAQLVIDRLAGYIATRGIQGRIKVWISGFSRAAAISNVVAGTLVSTGYLPREDIYAYTFATPAAIKNPPRQGYENIFNIINPADLVPQVMPAEWGYGRYGTDLFLSVQEFSTFTGLLDNILRSYANKDAYGVEYSYSSMLTLRLRLLMSLVLDLTEDVENYTACFQPALVGLLHNEALDNSVSILRELMQNVRILDREDKTHLDDLINYFMRVFSGVLLRSGYREADRNTGDILMRFMVEHTPNSYFSAVQSIRDQYFCSNSRCCYVMVRGPVSLTLQNKSVEMEQFTIRSDGTVSFFDSEEGTDFFRDLYYAERSGNTTVICVPMDYDYQVSWTAEKDGTVECVQAMAFLQAGSRYPGAASEKIRVRAGDTGVAFLMKDMEPVALEGFRETIFSAGTLVEFLGLVSLGFNWRTALTVLHALLAALVCVPLCLIFFSRPSRRKSFSLPIGILLCLLGIAVLETEAAYWFFADQLWVRVVWKGIAALCFLILFLVRQRKKGDLLRSFFPVILLAVAGDIVVSFHLMAGAGLFLLCQILLAYRFLRAAPLSRAKWIQWSIVSVAVAALIILFYVPSLGTFGWAAAFFAPVMLLMVFSMGKQPVRIRVSAILFLASDLLMGLYYTLAEDPIVHVIYMFLFYTALLLLTAGPSRSPGPLPSGADAAAVRGIEGEKADE